VIFQVVDGTPNSPLKMENRSDPIDFGPGAVTGGAKGSIAFRLAAFQANWRQNPGQFIQAI